MNSNFENGVLTIYPSGSIDTTNAESFGNEVDEILSNYPEHHLIVDLDSLEYISSAGLRQILRLSKKENDLKIINCSSEVYNIFEMTGFSQMMNISKGYRKLSVDGCEVIGEGSNGVVYRLSPDTIIKVYKNNDALEDIERERQLAQKALVLGVNTAIPFDIVNVNGKYGSVFELLSSNSLTKLIKANPDNKDKYIKVFADLLKEIHETVVEGDFLPSAKQGALRWVTWLKDHLPEDTYNKLHKLVDDVPESDHMIHGDYHTNNVHYDEKEAILIDMDTLSTGNPVFEFASIYLAFKGYGELDHTAIEKFLKLDYETAEYVLNKTFEFYFADKDEAFVQEVIKKARVVGYTRALRRTIKRTPDEKELIEHYRKELIELVNEVDSLII